MQKFTKVSDIRKVLPTLKTCSVPGKTTDGVRVSIRYECFNKITKAKTQRATPSGKKAIKRRIAEAKVASNSGFDLRIISGILDRVFLTKGNNPQLCATIFTQGRVDLKSARYCYRTINLSKGRVRWLQVGV